MKEKIIPVLSCIRKPVALNGKAYVVGPAMTDTPASLGTERFKPRATLRAQVMAFNNQQIEAPAVLMRLKLK